MSPHPTDTSEKGLETLIVAQMTGLLISPPAGPGLAATAEPFVGLHNWILGDPTHWHVQTR